MPKVKIVLSTSDEIENSILVAMANDMAEALEEDSDTFVKTISETANEVILEATISDPEEDDENA